MRQGKKESKRKKRKKRKERKEKKKKKKRKEKKKREKLPRRTWSMHCASTKLSNPVGEGHGMKTLHEGVQNAPAMFSIVALISPLPQVVV